MTAFTCERCGSNYSDHICDGEAGGGSITMTQAQYDRLRAEHAQVQQQRDAYKVAWQAEQQFREHLVGCLRCASRADCAERYRLSLPCQAADRAIEKLERGGS